MSPDRITAARNYRIQLSATEKGSRLFSTRAVDTGTVGGNVGLMTLIISADCALANAASWTVAK